MAGGLDLLASFYVCGGCGGMARGVWEMVEEVVEKEMGWEEGRGRE